MAVLVDGLRAPHEYYQRILDILGPTGIIIPIGDSEHESPVLAQVETTGEGRRKFTYNEPVLAWDTPSYLMGPAQIPIITFNGSNEEATSPGDAYWSRGDESNDSPFSLGVYVNLVDLETNQAILSKYQGVGTREWLYRVLSDGKLALLMLDENNVAFPQRTSDAAIGVGTWRFLVMTYDGTGGATVFDGVTLYNNGAVEPSTAFNDANYVAMGSTGGVVAVGKWGGAADRFGSKMAGGAPGPFFVQRELPVGDISDLYDVGQAFLGV